MSSTIAIQTGLPTMEDISTPTMVTSPWTSRGTNAHLPTVLFYFAQSPFFDRQSSNSSVFQQALSDYRFAHWLNTRENFETQLRRLSGLEYVVAYDPLAMNIQVDGPNGMEFSNVWVIKKQDRAKRAGQEDQVTVLAFYYIVGDAIYQAPSVAKILTNRMVRGHSSHFTICLRV